MKEPKVSIHINGNKIRVEFASFHKQEKGGVSSYIPGFDIYYSSETMKVALERTEPMIDHFMKFWIESKGWRAFIAKITALGFRADSKNEKQLKQLLNKQLHSARLSSALGFDKEEFDMQPTYEQHEFSI